jgi:hypothetical protein
MKRPKTTTACTRTFAIVTWKNTVVFNLRLRQNSSRNKLCKRRAETRLHQGTAFLFRESDARKEACLHTGEDSHIRGGFPASSAARKNTLH